MAKSVETKATQPELTVKDVEAWRSWLDQNEDVSDGVWLVMAKKGHTEPTSLTYAEALDEAICSGWIDGQRRSLNEVSFIQRFTPRRKASMWSMRNVDFIARLTAEGRMRPRGELEVAKAKADGRWERAYPGAATLVVPEDVLAALELAGVLEAFESLASQPRYASVIPVITARTSEQRAKKLERMVASLQSKPDTKPAA
jgi:uncharacterized protein YdeI (YjbR/CyaY-like superfamily)